MTGKKKFNTGNKYLGVITNPDIQFSNINYLDNAINLGTNRSSLIGLPNFLNPLQNCTLPLQITDFNVVTYTTNNINNVNWHLENTNEITSLSLEKSKDGVTFENILKLNNPLSQNSYEDKKIYPNSTYYRLKITSINNSISYSEIIQTSLNSKSNINAYPNPIQNILNISNGGSDEKNYQITILNNNGNLIHQSTITFNENNTCQINTSNYPDDIYILRIQSKNTISIQKIIKISQ